MFDGIKSMSPIACPVPRKHYAEITLLRSYALANLNMLAQSFNVPTVVGKPVELSDFTVKDRFKSESAITFALMDSDFPAAVSNYDFLINRNIPFYVTYRSYGRIPSGCISALFDDEPELYSVENYLYPVGFHQGEIEALLKNCSSVEMVFQELDNMHSVPFLVDWERQSVVFTKKGKC